MINRITLTFAGFINPSAYTFTILNQSGNPMSVVVRGTAINGDSVVVIDPDYLGGTLPDGRYTLQVNGIDVAKFFRFFGDVDGDADVDDIDRQAVIAAFRSTAGTPAYNWELDADSDCDDDATDYNQFLARYRRVLP